MSETAPEVYFRKLGEFPHAALFEGVTHAWEIGRSSYGFRPETGG